MLFLQWNLYVKDTLGPATFVLDGVRGALFSEVEYTLKVWESCRLGQENLAFIERFFCIVFLIQSVLYWRFLSNEIYNIMLFSA